MKNVIVLTVGLLVYIICAAVSCESEESDNCHTAIIFSNNSLKDVHIRAFNGGGERIPISLEEYRSTALTQYKVISGEQDNRRATDDGYCREENFKSAMFSDTLKFYILDAFVVENTPWEVVARDYLVLKRYDLSLSDLQKLDWRVTYPPTEAMKDVAQYPPYGSE